MKKRIMVIGPTNCGKTSLVHALNDDEGPVRKTQDIIYGKNTIDVPGAFVENAWMYKHLITVSQNASHLLLLLNQSKCDDVYSPGFAKVFRCPVIGVISKCDLIPENEEKCLRQLKQIGATEPYYKISNLNGSGIDALKNILFMTSERA